MTELNFNEHTRKCEKCGEIKNKDYFYIKRAICKQCYIANVLKKYDKKDVNKNICKCCKLENKTFYNNKRVCIDCHKLIIICDCLAEIKLFSFNSHLKSKKHKEKLDLVLNERINDSIENNIETKDILFNNLRLKSFVETRKIYKIVR